MDRRLFGAVVGGCAGRSIPLHAVPAALLRADIPLASDPVTSPQLLLDAPARMRRREMRRGRRSPRLLGFRSINAKTRSYTQ